MNRQTAKVLAEALAVDRYLESSGKMLRHFVRILSVSCGCSQRRRTTRARPNG